MLYEEWRRVELYVIVLKPIVKTNMDELSGADMPQNQRNGKCWNSRKVWSLCTAFWTRIFFFFKFALSNGYSPEDISLLEAIRAPSCHLLFRERTCVDHNIRSDTFTDWSLAGGWLEKNDSGHVLQSRWAGVTRSIISITVSQLQLSVLAATVLRPRSGRDLMIPCISPQRRPPRNSTGWQSCVWQTSFASNCILKDILSRYTV
jgi:hypothetical protein